MRADRSFPTPCTPCSPQTLARSSEFGWTDQEQGNVKASFAGGYLLLQIVGGVIGDKYGNKMFQTFCLVGFAIGMAVAPFAAAAGADTCGWVYFLMGLAAGPQHPTSTAHQKKWCLPSEKAAVSAIGGMVRKTRNFACVKSCCVCLAVPSSGLPRTRRTQRGACGLAGVGRRLALRSARSGLVCLQRQRRLFLLPLRSLQCRSLPFIRHKKPLFVTQHRRP